MALRDDIRQAWYGLRGTPGFLALASGVLALGLATTIFMYAVTFTLLDKPPPYPRADQLIGVRNTIPDIGALDYGFSYLDLLDLRERQTTLRYLAAAYTGTMTLSGNGRPERIGGVYASEDYLAVLGVRPVLGRGFLPADHRPGALPVLILTDDLWRTRFNRDPAVIGRSIRLNGESATVIGVLAPGVTLTSSRDLALTAIRLDRATSRRGDPNEVRPNLYGRLRDGATVEQSRAEIESLYADLARRYPDTNKGHVPWVAKFAESTAGQDAGEIIRLLFYSVWAVLAIACANVANLLFVRANQRAYESSMRVALGATRARLVSLTLAESLIVAVTASVLGLMLAAIGLDVMRRAMRSMFTDAPAWWDFALDWRVVAFAAGAALLSGIVAGLWPALRASRPDVMQVLRDGGRSGTGKRLSYFTNTMVVVEIALAVVMLAGAGLTLRTVLATLSADVGITTDGIMTGRVMLPEKAYDKSARAVFWTQLVERLKAIPGAETAFATDQLPGTGGGDGAVAIEGVRYADVSSLPRAHAVLVSPGYFAAISRGLTQGREFSDGDRPDTLLVAIIDETFARRLLPDGKPLGRRIRLNPEDSSSPWLTIIGVAPNIRYGDDFSTLNGFKPNVYTSLAQLPERFVSIAVRGSGNPRRFAEPMRSAVASLDGDLPMYFVGTLRERQDEGRAGMKVISSMFSVFAAIAVLLAAAGLYGVLAFTTSRRVREIGIRRALGARDAQILRSVLRAAAVQLGIGLAAGAVLAPLMVVSLPTFITAGRPHDLGVYSAVLLLIATSVMIAAWVPSIRALRIQPAVALRYE